MGSGVSSPRGVSRTQPRPAHGLPTRDGVGASCVGLPIGPWATILDFLVERFPSQGGDVWQKRMQRGEVVDEHGAPVSALRRFQAPLRVYYYREVADEVPIPFEAAILFRDDHLVVIDKPHFLPVTPSGNYLQHTALVRLKRSLGLDDLVPIHRIDRDTAGVVLFSVQPASRDCYQALFRTHRVDKLYEAIAPWRSDLQLPLVRRSRLGVSAHFMQQCEIDGTPNTCTEISLLELRGSLARYQLRPGTGHRHQLRVHMAALGIPILHDGIYPVLTAEGSMDTTRPLQLLAKAIAFDDPIAGIRRSFVSRRQLCFSTFPGASEPAT